MNMMNHFHKIKNIFLNFIILTCFIVSKSSFSIPLGDAAPADLKDALLKNDLKKISFLVQEGKVINPVINSSSKTTLLIWASGNGHLEIVKAIWDKMPPASDFNEKSEFEDTPLHAAARHGQLETAKAILAKMPPGSNFNPKDDVAENTPLHSALKYGHPEIAKAILEKMPPTSNFNEKNADNDTPLHLASAKGYLEIVKFILDRISLKRDENLDNITGDTPLHKAATYGHLAVIKAILKKIPHEDLIKKKNKKGETFIDIAKINKQEKILTWYNKLLSRRNILSQATITIDNNQTPNLSHNEQCYQAIKNIELKIMESVWPTLSTNSKKEILYNTTCNNFLRENEELYPGFQVGPRTYVSHKLQEFSKNLKDHFLEICTQINQSNYYTILQKTANNRIYGNILASYLQKRPLVSEICPGINIEIKKNLKGPPFPVPTYEELPQPYQVNSARKVTTRYIGLTPTLTAITSSNYAALFDRYRNGKILKSQEKGLTNELACLPPFECSTPSTLPKTSLTVWRRAGSAFNNTPFHKLVTGKIYCEHAPTCTSKDSPLHQRTISGHLKIEIPTEYNLSRLIQIFSKNPHEREVLFPPGSCFEFIGVDKEIPPGHSHEVDVYHFKSVPWTKDKHYGYFSRKEALFDANKYYGKHYPEGSDAISIFDGSSKRYIVERPNHGLTHGARQAYLLLDLLQHLAHDSGKYGALGEWARKIQGDLNKKDVLFLMALHFRSARKAETGNHFDVYVSHMKHILKKYQRNLTDAEIDDYANLLSKKPNLSSDDKKFTMMALDLAHRADHLRQQFWNVNESEKDMQYTIGANGEQNETNQNELIAFMQDRAGKYLKATGAYNKKEEIEVEDKTKWMETKENIKGYWFSDAKLFGRLENNPYELYDVMENTTLDKNEI